MAFLMVNGLRMYYAEHGDPHGPPLLLLHGFTSTGESWSNQLARFGALYRLIIPDLRAHGQTVNPDGGAAMNHRQFARDIIGLCHAMDIERAAFCGESTGAMLLLSLAVFEPGLPAVLILSGGTHYFGKECIALQRQVTPETIDAGWRRYMESAHASQGPGHWRVLVQNFHDLHTHARADDFPAPEELSGIQAPVLIVHGDRDPYFPVEMPLELFRLLPNAEFCLLPNTGHVPPEEQPDRFNDIALDFLGRHYQGQ